MKYGETMPSLNFEISEIDVFDLPSVPLDQRSLLPECPGIYFAALGAKILYVGKAVNIKNRWAGCSHHRYYELSLRGNVRLYWLEVYEDEKGWLYETESEWIKLLKPPLNGSSISYEKDNSVVSDLRERIAELEAQNDSLIRQQDAADSVHMALYDIGCMRSYAEKLETLLSKTKRLGGVDVVKFINSEEGDAVLKLLDYAISDLQDAERLFNQARDLLSHPKL